MMVFVRMMIRKHNDLRDSAVQFDAAKDRTLTGISKCHDR
jgi:hypothetical protein